MNVFVPDALRQAVEAATGGECTILYSSNGYPSSYFILPQFRLEDIDESLGSGIHPAFIINGIEVQKLFIAQYTARPADGSGEAISLPGYRPALIPSFADASASAYQNGPGYHLMTNVEWAAVSLWCWKHGKEPHGNDSYGRYSLAHHERGQALTWPGYTYRPPAILPGTGPSTWRHNHKTTGISDLVGNMWEWVGGLRLFDGEIQVSKNNDHADKKNLNTWFAISSSSGDLVPLGTPGTVKVYTAATPGATANAGAFSYASTIGNSLVSSGQYNVSNFGSLTGSAILKALRLAPMNESEIGKMWVRNWGIHYAARGGDFFPDHAASLQTLAIGGTEFTTVNGVIRVVKY